jgi:hypothetical protein
MEGQPVDEWDAMGHGMKVDRRSTDWGIVSVTIGACFLIMSPIMLMFTMLYWVQGVRHHTREEIQIVRVATVAIDGFFLALIAFGIFAAFRSMSLARATGHPSALGIAGMLMCGLNVILWIGLGIDLLAVLNVF